MRNGRAPENSYGNGKNHEFVNWGAKAGATYKIDGRNNIAAHVYYGTKAPEFNYAYVSPRIKDDVITPTSRAARYCRATSATHGATTTSRVLSRDSGPNCATRPSAPRSTTTSTALS
jgi:hypothetical protein